jgi:hypothetical protein
VPVIIAGPQASNYVQTVGTLLFAQLNKAVRDAAIAQPNCLAHIDMVGHASTGVLAPAYTSGAAMRSVTESPTQARSTSAAWRSPSAPAPRT